MTGVDHGIRRDVELVFGRHRGDTRGRSHQRRRDQPEPRRVDRPLERAPVARVRNGGSHGRQRLAALDEALILFMRACHGFSLLSATAH